MTPQNYPHESRKSLNIKGMPQKVLAIQQTNRRDLAKKVRQ